MALLRSAATVGGYTMVSRVLGFVREMLVAAYLGASPLSDAFFVALRLPNMFRSLFAEGAFSAAFVPVFSGKVAADGRGVARGFAEDALAVLLAALLVFLVMGEALTPWILDIIAPGFRNTPEKFELAVDLTRIMFPYLLFISLTALQGGVLNSLERFAATAFTPVLLNLFLIGVLVGVRPLTGRALAWAVTSAGAAQFLWLTWSCAAAGLPLSLPRPRLTPEVKKLLRIVMTQNCDSTLRDAGAADLTKVHCMWSGVWGRRQGQDRATNKCNSTPNFWKPIDRHFFRTGSRTADPDRPRSFACRSGSGTVIGGARWPKPSNMIVGAGLLFPLCALPL
jgi:O-antigen/teichoic acid export membrane protein